MDEHFKTLWKAQDELRWHEAAYAREIAIYNTTHRVHEWRMIRFHRQKIVEWKEAIAALQSKSQSNQG